MSKTHGEAQSFHEVATKNRELTKRRNNTSIQEVQNPKKEHHKT